MKQNSYYLILLAFFSLPALAQELGNFEEREKFDLMKRESLAQECLYNKQFLKPNYHIQCELNYHHYNSAATDKYYSKAKALAKGNVKIAEFNALHPGMSKTLFKDYKKVAQLINRYDVVGVTELIPLVANDFDNNLAVVDFVKSAPDEIKADQAELKTLNQEQSEKYSVVRARKIKLLKLKIAQMKADLKQAAQLYRAPGYVRILEELQKLKNGKEWALILSPRGEAASTSPTEELVGYYYRSSVVKPKSNDYCQGVRKFGKASPLACIINMGTRFFDEDKSHVFSRRPFLAEFISGRFTFMLITSHVIFDSPKNEDLMENIVESAFGVSSYEELGIGVQKSNYARFAEIKVTLDFINNYLKDHPKKDVIFMGDFNLEADNKFWPEVLNSWPGAELYITEKTSTNQARYDGAGNPTNAVTSNYDHFVFDPKNTSECLNSKGELKGGAFDFQKGRFASYIDRIYKVRTEDKINDQEYEVDSNKYKKVYNKFVQPYLEKNSTQMQTIASITHKIEDKYTLSSKGIVPSEREMEFYGENFVKRVMDSQLSDGTYYYFYEQVISDHLPIFVECSNN